MHRVVVVWMLAAVTAMVARGQFYAGAGSRVISPDVRDYSKHSVYMGGFGKDRKATGIHDPLYARCVAFAAGSKTAPLVICGVDSIGLFWEDTLRIRKVLAQRKVGVQGLIVAATHSHQAPDTMGLWGPGEKTGIDEAYTSRVIAGTADAAAEAVRRMQAAKARVVTVRNPELDSFIDDDRPPKRHDSDVIAVEALDARTGKPIAVLVNWANHPEALGSKNRMLSADYVARLRTRIEELHAGAVAVFVNGALGGMQSPLGAAVPGGLKDGTFEKAEYIGVRVADLTAAALDKAGEVEIGRVEYREKTIRIPLSNPGFRQAMEKNMYAGRKPLNADGTTTTVVGMFRLGTVLEGATVPGELYPELSVGGVERYTGADFPQAPIEPAVKASMMRAPHRMLIGLANDEIGYIIPKAEWDDAAPWLNGAKKRWYGEVNSIGPEAAPAIAAALAELFGK
ncbi:MAG: hypothetical protein JST65_24195 [Acidobacteria bacterium]|nr:hypothetical protein [Acidobacteriota bacterium]